MKQELLDAEARRLAACHTGEDVLVSASAGTGKTRLLVDRVMHLIAGGGVTVDVDKLLVVTFTEAAAAEMKARVLERLLGMSRDKGGSPRLARQLELLPRAQISTVHSFCLALVRSQFHTLGLDPGMEVMDAQEADLLLQEVLDELLEARYAHPDEGFLALIDAYAGDRSDAPVRAMALGLLAFARGQPDPAAWLSAAVERLGCAGADDPETIYWLPALAELVAGDLDYAASLLARAVERCGMQDGPAAYLPIIASEQGRVAAAASAIRAANAPEPRPAWSVLQCYAQSLAKEPRLPAAKGAPAAGREAAQHLRGRAWEAVGKAQTLVGRRPAAELADELRQAAVPIRALVDLVIDLERTARDRRAGAGKLDFADFEYYAVRLLCQTDDRGQLLTPASPAASALALELRRRYAAVLVDEYQDINPAQELILRMVSDRNLFTVGDIKQSIYGFRGTEPEGFLRLMRSYSSPGDADRDHRTGLRLTLHSNFRSRKTILATANFVFAQVMTGPVAGIEYDAGAMLAQGTHDYDGAPNEDAPVELYLLERKPGRANESPAPDGSGDDEPPPHDRDTGQAAFDDAETDLDDIEREATLVGRRILAMVGRGGGVGMVGGGGAEFSVFDRSLGVHRPVGFGDIAILLRTVQGRANRYLERLAAMGIPVRAELPTGYFAAIEIETVLSLLRIIDNPRQDIPLAAVLRSPVVGLDEDQLADVRLAGRQGAFYDAAVARAAVADDLGARLGAFLADLADWRTAARRGPLSDLVWRLLESTDYLSFVAGLPGGRQRQANLIALHDRAREFDRFARQGLARFLRFIEELHTAKHDLGAVSDPGLGLECVFLTSIHKAKGLEFPVVFLPDLGKQFHGSDGRDVLWHRELGLGPRLAMRSLGVKYPTVAWRVIERRQARDALAEEMRVLYVAMTRARERLVLSGSVSKLDDALARWTAPCQGQTGMALPPATIGRDRTYLDWICRAVGRHPAARPSFFNPEPVGRSDEHAATVDSLNSRWSVQTLRWPESEPAIGGNTIVGNAGEGEEKLSTAEVIAMAGRMEPITPPPPELASTLAARYGWTYPHPWLARLPAKVSVSELRQLADLIDAEESGLLPELAGGGGLDAGRPEQHWGSPALGRWGERRRLTPALRGTLVHHVLGRLRFADGLTPTEAAVRGQVADLVARRLLAAEAAQLEPDDLAALAWFAATPVGRRVTAGGADAVKELPFTMALPAAQVAGRLLAGHAGAHADDMSLDAALDGETILVQGIVDCLLRLPEGFELLEYKTDRVTSDDAAAAVERYRVQLGLYASAIEAALGRPVRAVHLVLLHPRVIVPVDPASLRR